MLQGLALLLFECRVSGIGNAKGCGIGSIGSNANSTSSLFFRLLSASLSACFVCLKGRYTTVIPSVRVTVVKITSINLSETNADQIKKTTSKVVSSKSAMGELAVGRGKRN